MTDARTLNAQQHNEKIARIRSNPDLSEGAKRRMIGEIHQKALAEHARLTEEASEAREEAVRSEEGKVLGLSYPERLCPREGPHRPLLPGSPRPCRARTAADTDNPDALVELMERAETSGDAQLAEAAYHVATLRGARAIANAYLADRPRRAGGGRLMSKPARRTTRSRWTPWQASWAPNVRPSSARERSR